MVAYGQMRYAMRHDGGTMSCDTIGALRCDTTRYDKQREEMRDVAIRHDATRYDTILQNGIRHHKPRYDTTGNGAIGYDRIGWGRK